MEKDDLAGFHMIPKVKTLFRRHAKPPKRSFLQKISSAPDDIINQSKSILRHLFLPAPYTKKKLGFDPKDEIDTSTIIGKVQDVLLPLIGYVDKTVLLEHLKRLKMPVISAVGIATIAGLAYLAYRLYKARQERHNEDYEEQHATDVVLEDLQNSAPDLFNIPGWAQTIKQKVDEIIKHASESEFVSKIAQLKSEILNQQHKISPIDHKGGAILLRLATKPKHIKRNKKPRTGRGVIKPIY